MAGGGMARFLEVACLLSAVAAARGASVVGGPTAADLNDYVVTAALNFAVSEHNVLSSDNFVSVLQSVTKAQQQVVSGMKYTFEVKLATTTCSKSNVKKSCPVNVNMKPSTCNFEVWTKSWESWAQLTKNTCN
ncbi:cystatin-like [Denticeps clupeoides]|uniref:cystatin-like n=1 Tax=Denticeps clupeoides TaxID=299321 RepID=UPI0010A553AB|nr:cystatin-like [Denticeps clupeoides]